MLVIQVQTYVPLENLLGGRTPRKDLPEECPRGLGGGVSSVIFAHTVYFVSFADGLFACKAH